MRIRSIILEHVEVLRTLESAQTALIAVAVRQSNEKKGASA